jgi:hypothetical protein
MEMVVEPLVEVVEILVEIQEPPVEMVVEPLVEVVEILVEMQEPLVEMVVEPLVEVVEILEMELAWYLMVYPLRGVGHRVEYNLDRYLRMQMVELGMGANPGTYSHRRRESLYWANTRFCSTHYRPKASHQMP